MRNNNNKLKAFVRFDGSGRVISSSLIVQAFKPKVGNWKEISAKECCNGAFDVTANWYSTIPAVTNAATFKTFLQSGTDGNSTTNSLTNVNVIDFSLINGRLRANLTATGTNLALGGISASSVNSVGNISGLTTLDLTGNILTSVDQTIFPDSLTILYLTSNLIVTFNPSRPLPASLIELYLTSNQIVTFDPTIALPSSLEILYLNANLIVTFNPTIALPSGLKKLYLNSNKIVTFNPTIALPIGLKNLNLINNLIVTFNPTIGLPTGLTTLSLATNKIVTFNPTLALPTTISSLSLASNLMTTAGYTASVPWATAMGNIPGRGTVVFTGNSNPVTGTTLATTLTSKGWTVTA
jgi:Leucine-rich repeat (LRR) protein